MDATCKIQDNIHVFSLAHKYVSRILGTYHIELVTFSFLVKFTYHRILILTTIVYFSTILTVKNHTIIML